MNTDGYLTIKALASAKLVEKRSTFLAFAHPVQTDEEVDEILRDYRKKYYDARHVCYAFCLGRERQVARSSDNGEPSGTAGRPIMGTILSANLTNILIVVIRYFGGVKLGTPGLIAAYKGVAELAISQAEIIERTQDGSITFSYDYAQMNHVMTVLKSMELKPEKSDFGMTCHITLSAPQSVIAQLKILLADFVQFE